MLLRTGVVTCATVRGSSTFFASTGLLRWSRDYSTSFQVRFTGEEILQGQLSSQRVSTFPPRHHAAVQVFHSSKSLRQQKLTCNRAATAALADDDCFAFAIDIIESVRQLGQANVFCTGKCTEQNFKRFADVDNLYVHPGLEPLYEFFRLNVHHVIHIFRIQRSCTVLYAHNCSERKYHRGYSIQSNLRLFVCQRSVRFTALPGTTIDIVQTSGRGNRHAQTRKRKKRNHVSDTHR